MRRHATPELGFQAIKRGARHLCFRHDHDVDAARGVVQSEQLTRHPLEPIPDDGIPDFPGRRYADPGEHRCGLHRDHGHEAAVKPGTARINLLELRPAAKPARTTHSDRYLARGLALVRNRQPLPTLGPAARKYDPAVLRGHPDAEPVRLRATPRVRLIRSLTLHESPMPGLNDCRGNPYPRCLGGGVSIGGMWYRQPRLLRNRDLRRAARTFGFPPKFSTYVEKSVKIDFS